MHAVGQAQSPWLPLHEVVGSLLRELSKERKALSLPGAEADQRRPGTSSGGRLRTELGATPAPRELASTRGA